MITMDKSILRQTSNPVCLPKDIDILTKCKDALLDEYHLHDGKMQGLAAIQLSLPYQVVLLRYKKGKSPKVIYNPKVIWKFGGYESNEGCESEKGRWIMKRPLLALVSYYDAKTKIKHYRLLQYKYARIFCHEYDHLYGILISDRGVRAK